MGILDSLKYLDKSRFHAHEKTSTHVRARPHAPPPAPTHVLTVHESRPRFATPPEAAWMCRGVTMRQCIARSPRRVSSYYWHMQAIAACWSLERKPFSMTAASASDVACPARIANVHHRDMHTR